MIDSAAESPVQNSQPAGIGRVAPLDEGCAWNNLGRNVVFADRSLHPRAVFADTDFPSDDETSQFDLDIHAIVDLGADGRVAVLNHLGIVRTFAPWESSRTERESTPRLTPLNRLDFIADLERITTLGDRLITSRPRGDRLGGVLVSAPVFSANDRLEADATQESFGFVTALAAGSSVDIGGWVALGGEGRVRLVSADRGRLGETRWERDLEFLAAVIVQSGTTLWVAGSASGGTDLDDYDWEQLRGGGVVQLDLATADVISSASFGHELGWGSGGVPLVVAHGIPCGVGRHGDVSALGAEEDVLTPVTDRLTSHSLGIAHAAIVGEQIVYGFNRGGYELHTVPLSTITLSAAS